MPRTREQILEERRRQKAEYGELFDAVSSLLYRHDPIRIAFNNENSDEYDPETGTILPRLRNCASASNEQRVVHDEFVRWRGAARSDAAVQMKSVTSKLNLESDFQERYRNGANSPHIRHYGLYGRDKLFIFVGVRSAR